MENLNNQKLSGKIAVITGGNSGIGLATAKLFYEQGAQVIITARSPASFEKAKQEYGKIFDIYLTDVTNFSQLESMAQQVKEKYGKVDVLFANAGVARFAPFTQITPEFFDEQFSTNVKGVFYTVQLFTPLMSSGGSVLLNTSVVNTKGLPGSTVYAATKAGVRSLARTLSAELSPRGIRVNAISPGPIETPIFDKMNLSPEEKRGFSEQLIAATPMGRFGLPEEIAQVALFLGSQDASFVLGTEVVVDGGLSQL